MKKGKTTMTNQPLIRRKRHVAQSARILSTGITATAILAMTAAYAAAEQAPTQSTSAPIPTEQNISQMQTVALVTPIQELAPLGGTTATTTAGRTAQAVAAAVKQASNTSAPAAVVAPVVTPAPAAVVTVVATAPAATTVPVPVATIAPAPAPTPVQLQAPQSTAVSNSGGSK
jgi:predicted extracellular nuclease